MANSKTEICNMALSYLGANLIMDENDETTEARLCNLNYDNCLEAVLEDIDWTFATKRYVYKNPVQDPPEYGFSFGFLLHPEILRVIEVNGNRYDWVLENRHILTNQATVEVKAIIKVEDANRYPPMFVKALAAYLASEIALPLTNNPQHQQAMAQQYMAKRVWAQSNDGRQGKAQRKFSTDWVR